MSDGCGRHSFDAHCLACALGGDDDADIEVTETDAYNLDVEAFVRFDDGTEAWYRRQPDGWRCTQFKA